MQDLREWFGQSDIPSRRLFAGVSFAIRGNRPIARSKKIASRGRATQNLALDGARAQKSDRGDDIFSDHGDDIFRVILHRYV